MRHCLLLADTTIAEAMQNAGRGLVMGLQQVVLSISIEPRSIIRPASHLNKCCLRSGVYNLTPSLLMAVAPIYTITVALTFCVLVMRHAAITCDLQG